MAFDHPELMPQMLATRAAQQGGGTALQHVDGSALRWDDAYSDALRWADALERLGTRRGQPIVTIFSNSFAAYRSWLGCAWLGAIEAPVNTNYKGDWLRHIVNNTEAEVVLTESRFSQPLFDIADQLSHVKHCVVFGSLDSPPRSLPFNVLSEADFLDGATVRERAEPEPWGYLVAHLHVGYHGSSDAGEDARAPPLADHGLPPFDRTGAVRGP